MGVRGLASDMAQPAAKLPEQARLALDDILRRVVDLFPDSVQHILLFGSDARGEWREASDWECNFVYAAYPSRGFSRFGHDLESFRQGTDQVIEGMSKAA